MNEERDVHPAARYGALLAAVGMLIGGTVEAGDEGLSAALFAAGFILLGSWLAVEVYTLLGARRRGREDREQA